MDNTTFRSNLEERVAHFGEAVINLCRTINQDSITKPLISQLIRSSSSIGANYAEANAGSSKRDFRNKIFICKKEAQESKYWLRLLAHSSPSKKDELINLQEEARELLLIFQKITSTLRSKEMEKMTRNWMMKKLSIMRTSITENWITGNSLKTVNYKLKTITSIFFAFYLLFFISPTASAQGAISPSISISPAIVRESIDPGKTTTIDLKLANMGADSIPLSASKTHINSISDDGAPIFSQLPQPRSAVDWITITQPDVILNPGESRNVSIEVKPPADTAPGGYHAAIIFQAKLPSYYFDLDASTRVLPALSVSLLLTIKTDQMPTISDLNITGFHLPKIVVSSPIPLITEINNPTNFYIFVNGEITLNSTFGSEKQVSQFKESILLPDSSRKYIEAYAGSIWPGIYNATAKLKQGDKVLVASAKFIALPWQFMVALLLTLIIIIGLAGRKRFKRAWAALIHGAEPKKRPIIR